MRDWWFVVYNVNIKITKNLTLQKFEALSNILRNSDSQRPSDIRGVVVDELVKVSVRAELRDNTEWFKDDSWAN